MTGSKMFHLIWVEFTVDQLHHPTFLINLKILTFVKLIYEHLNYLVAHWQSLKNPLQHFKKAIIIISQSLLIKVKERKKVKSLSCVQLFATPWIVAYQVPPSIRFSRRENWSGLPFSRRSSQPRDWTQVSNTVGRCFTIWATREIHNHY